MNLPSGFMQNESAHLRLVSAYQSIRTQLIWDRPQRMDNRISKLAEYIERICHSAIAESTGSDWKIIVELQLMQFEIACGTVFKGSKCALMSYLQQLCMRKTKEFKWMAFASPWTARRSRLRCVGWKINFPIWKLHAFYVPITNYLMLRVPSLMRARTWIGQSHKSRLFSFHINKIVWEMELCAIARCVANRNMHLRKTNVTQNEIRQSDNSNNSNETFGFFNFLLHRRNDRRRNGKQKQATEVQQKIKWFPFCRGNRFCECSHSSRNFQMPDS